MRWTVVKNQLAEFTERGKFIPLRLTFGERKLLRLCEAALNVSERGDRFSDFVMFRLASIRKVLFVIIILWPVSPNTNATFTFGVLFPY